MDTCAGATLRFLPAQIHFPASAAADEAESSPDGSKPRGRRLRERFSARKGRERTLTLSELPRYKRRRKRTRVSCPQIGSFRRMRRVEHPAGSSVPAKQLPEAISSKG